MWHYIWWMVLGFYNLPSPDNIATFWGWALTLSHTQPTCTSQWETVWWTKSNFLDLLVNYQNVVKEQWDCEDSPYSRICISIWVSLASKICISPRNLTWFIRVFFSVFFRAFRGGKFPCLSFKFPPQTITNLSDQLDFFHIFSLNKSNFPP